MEKKDESFFQGGPDKEREFIEYLLTNNRASELGLDPKKTVDELVQDLRALGKGFDALIKKDQADFGSEEEFRVSSEDESK